jgi:hypothetical protein
MNKFASRKFWLAVVFQSVFTAMMYFGKMPADIFENLTYMILGGYFISNVSQKVFVKDTVE